MRFNIANTAPVTVTIDGIDYQLPRIRRGFWIKWAAEIDSKRTAEAVQNLPPTEAAKLLLIYPVEPTMHQELVRRMSTPDGIGRIIRESASKASPAVPGDVLDAWLDGGDEIQLESLALVLASLTDLAERADKANAQMDEGGEAKTEGPPDPLASSPKGSTG